VVVVAAVDDVGVGVPEFDEEVIVVGIVGAVLFDNIDCLNARGAVGGTTPVPRALGGGVEADGGCWIGR